MVIRAYNSTFWIYTHTLNGKKLSRDEKFVNFLCIAGINFREGVPVIYLAAIKFRQFLYLIGKKKSVKKRSAKKKSVKMLVTSYYFSHFLPTKILFFKN